mmetsp:Transcript_16817/g.42581  ORF Transcript_16817/g.42581 Transcript_16817/m.42581 type:complete len:234 (+) Transcript_16817:238-939(+)
MLSARRWMRTVYSCGGGFSVDASGASSRTTTTVSRPLGASTTGALRSCTSPPSTSGSSRCIGCPCAVTTGCRADFLLVSDVTTVSTTWCTSCGTCISYQRSPVRNLGDSFPSSRSPDSSTAPSVSRLSVSTGGGSHTSPAPSSGSGWYSIGRYAGIPAAACCCGCARGGATSGSLRGDRSVAPASSELGRASPSGGGGGGAGGTALAAFRKRTLSKMSRSEYAASTNTKSRAP